MKEHQEEIRQEMKREQRTFRNIVDALHQSVVADPMRAESYLSDDIGQESSPHQRTQEATAHLGITLSYRIARPNKSPSLLGAAALVRCASTVRVIREWLQENPEDAAAIEKSINDFLSSARLHEDDFNTRTAEENRKTVTTSWTNPPKAPPTKGKLPADAAYGLNILCQAAEEELTAIQQDEDDLYFQDTHYDAHLTWLWARLMQQQLPQLTTSGRT